jgi:hypothetical protein
MEKKVAREALTPPENLRIFSNPSDEITGSTASGPDLFDKTGRR